MIMLLHNIYFNSTQIWQIYTTIKIRLFDSHNPIDVWCKQFQINRNKKKNVEMGQESQTEVVVRKEKNKRRDRIGDVEPFYFVRIYYLY